MCESSCAHTARFQRFRLVLQQNEAWVSPALRLEFSPALRLEFTDALRQLHPTVEPSNSPSHAQPDTHDTYVLGDPGLYSVADSGSTDVHVLGMKSVGTHICLVVS